jgi:hypothetical protein
MRIGRAVPDDRREITEQTEITEQPASGFVGEFCLFRYFRLFRNLSEPFAESELRVQAQHRLLGARMLHFTDRLVVLLYSIQGRD